MFVPALRALPHALPLRSARAHARAGGVCVVLPRDTHDAIGAKPSLVAAQRLRLVALDGKTPAILGTERAVAARAPGT